MRILLACYYRVSNKPQNPEKIMRENLKPILEQLKGRLGDTEEIRATLLKNLAQTRTTLEGTAKEVVRQTKESRIVTEYVRPAIESDKAEQALTQLETSFAKASPLVAKLREIRKQFLAATKPHAGKSPRKKKAAKHSED
jgi:hypothetical protein